MYNWYPLFNSPVSGHPPYFSLVSAYGNSSRKRTALLTDTFSNARGCPPTRELTVVSMILILTRLRIVLFWKTSINKIMGYRLRSKEAAKTSGITEIKLNSFWLVNKEIKWEGFSAFLFSQLSSTRYHLWVDGWSYSMDASKPSLDKGKNFGSQLELPQNWESRRMKR